MRYGAFLAVLCLAALYPAPNGHVKAVITDTSPTDCEFALEIHEAKWTIGHPYRELAPNEASQFGGKAVAGMKAYMVRGMAFNETNGGFSLAIDGTKLWVRHDSLGPVTKLNCAPILVYLRNAPVEVFVSAAIDQ